MLLKLTRNHIPVTQYYVTLTFSYVNSTLTSMAVRYNIVLAYNHFILNKKSFYFQIRRVSFEDNETLAKPLDTISNVLCGKTNIY